MNDPTTPSCLHPIPVAGAMKEEGTTGGREPGGCRTKSRCGIAGHHPTALPRAASGRRHRPGASGGQDLRTEPLPGAGWPMGGSSVQVGGQRRAGYELRLHTEVLKPGLSVQQPLHQRRGSRAGSRKLMATLTGACSRKERGLLSARARVVHVRGHARGMHSKHVRTRSGHMRYTGEDTLREHAVHR